jgi:hypothetical protein
MQQWVAAQTSPVYVRVDGRSPPPDAATIAVFTSHLDRMLEWVRQEARCENDQQRRHLAGIFQDAREALGRKVRTP